MPFIILMSMDVLSSPACLQSFLKMGGIDVYPLIPMSMFFHNGTIVSPNSNVGIFVGNMRKIKESKRRSAALIIAVPAYLAENGGGR